MELIGRQPLLRRDVRARAVDDGWLVLDARQLSFASPLDLTALVAMAHAAAARRDQVGLIMPQDVDVASYLQRMDLLQRLPPEVQIEGPLPPERRGDASRVLLEVSPLSPTTVDHLVTRLGRLAVERFGRGIAGLVFRGAGELIDNAVSHGQSRLGAFVAAQTYTGVTSGRPGLEFAVCDTGVGVLDHLRGNPEYSGIPDAPSALAQALKPGVTGTSELRGYGLADLLQITHDGGLGRLLLRSGDGVASIVLRQQTRHDLYRTASPPIAGTWAWLRVRFP